MSKNTLFPGIDLGLDPYTLIDPDDQSDTLPLFFKWQQGGFGDIDDGDALRLRQWVLSRDCPLAQDCRDYYLHCYAWEARNRERMTMINQFFRLRPEVWGIRLAIYKNPHTQLVHLGEGEFAKSIDSKPGKLLRPSDGKSVWTKVLLPQAPFRACLYRCLDEVRKKGGVGYLLGLGEQCNMKF